MLGIPYGLWVGSSLVGALHERPSHDQKMQMHTSRSANTTSKDS